MTKTYELLSVEIKEDCYDIIALDKTQNLVYLFENLRLREDDSNNLEIVTNVICSKYNENGKLVEITDQEVFDNGLNLVNNIITDMLKDFEKEKDI